MTCFEKYISEHELPVVGCPHDFHYAPKPENCYSMSCFKDCWARTANDHEQLKEKK